jgi:hypothetical protein
VRATRTSRTIQRIAYDRWVRALGVLLLVAACSPNGLTVEVVIDDPAIVKVELFAGRDCDPDCPRGTVAPGLPPLRVDNAYVVDDPAPFVTKQTDFSDGVAGFRIESTQDATLAILVAVGYDAQNQIRWSWSRHGVEIPDADSERWQVYLDPTTAIGPTLDPQPAGTHRVATWPDPAGHPSCLLLEYWNTSATTTRDLLGPANDTDCDGIAAANECAPWIPNAAGAPPTLDTANCVTPDLHIGTTSVCTIAGPQCTENPALPSVKCAAIDPPYCTPTALCTCAGRIDEQACITQLIAQGTNTADAMPFVTCVLFVDPSGNRCDSSSMELDAGAVLSGGSRKCTALRFNDMQPPLGAFDAYLRVGDGKLELSNFSEPCKADLTWHAGTAPLVNYGLVDADIDNGYHLVMPVRVDVKPGCATAGTSSCQIVIPTNTAETMFQCVEAAPSMAACGPDPNGLCASGPLCGSQCCKQGEHCGPNGCMCGLGPRCSDGDICASGGAMGEFQCGNTCCGESGPCPL